MWQGTSSPHLLHSNVSSWTPLLRRLAESVLRKDKSEVNCNYETSAQSCKKQKYINFTLFRVTWAMMGVGHGCSYRMILVSERARAPRHNSPWYRAPLWWNLQFHHIQIGSFTTASTIAKGIAKDILQPSLQTWTYLLNQSLPTILPLMMQNNSYFFPNLLEVWSGLPVLIYKSQIFHNIITMVILWPG